MIEWDGSRVYMSVYHEDGTILYSGSVSQDGGYNGFRFINVGNEAYHTGPAVGSTLEITDIRLSILG